MTFVVTPWALTAAPGYVRQLVTPPMIEPLTIAEGKLRAGLDWPDDDPRDALMQEWIAAARAQVEHDTGLALLTQVWDVVFAAGGYGPLVPLPPQTQPTQTITDVETEPAVICWQPRGYVPGLHYTVAWPEGTVRITAGWPSVEALKAQAPGLYHGVALLVAHYATLGRDLAALGGASTTPALMPMGYDEAIGPHRLVWV